MTQQTHPQRNRGALLLEVAVSLGLLTALASILLKYSLSIIQSEQWNTMQALTDASLTYELAYARRIPFQDLEAVDSPFPLYPNYQESTVTLGASHGGYPVTATVKRTRLQLGEGANQTGLESWKLMSVLVYKINGNLYHKSRQTIRNK